MSQARRLFVALVVVAVVVLSASAADAGGVSPGPDPVGRPDQPVAGQYIVTLRDSSSSIPGAADLLARLHDFACMLERAIARSQAPLISSRAFTAASCSVRSSPRSKASPCA